MRGYYQSRVMTPLGAALISVADAREPRVDQGFVAQVATYEVYPQLPPGMRLDAVIRVDVTITASMDGIAPEILFILDNEDLTGGGDPGEWLESIQFEQNGTVLTLGASDRDWMQNQGVAKGFLPSRFEHLASAHEGYVVNYQSRGLCISFGRLAQRESIFCPLALAYVSGLANPKDEYWTWYGVGAVIP